MKDASRRPFTYDLTLSEAIAAARDYSFKALLDGKDPDAMLAYCEDHFWLHIADLDDSLALRHAIYLLCVRRERFAAVSGSDEGSIIYGVALAALKLWKEMPRSGPPVYTGGPSQPACPETKTFLAVIFTEAWSARQTETVASLHLFREILALPTFGHGEDEILQATLRAAANPGCPLERLRCHLTTAIEDMALDAGGAVERMPHKLLPVLLDALTQHMHISHDTMRHELPAFAAALQACSVLTGVRCPAAGKILRAAADRIANDVKRTHELARRLLNAGVHGNVDVEVVDEGVWRVVAKLAIEPHQWHTQAPDDRAARMSQRVTEFIDLVREARAALEIDRMIAVHVTVTDRTSQRALDPLERSEAIT